MNFAKLIKRVWGKSPLVVSLSNHGQVQARSSFDKLRAGSNLPLIGGGIARPQFRKLLAASAGFTLMEAAVALSILSLGVTLVGQGIFQSLAVQGYWQDGVVATKDLRHASSYFAGDALIAETTDLADGAQVTCADDGFPCVELGWTDGGGSAHTAQYSLSGNTLVRDRDGARIPIAPRVVQVGFARSGATVTLTLEVEAERGGTDTISLQTYLRKLS